MADELGYQFQRTYASPIEKYRQVATIADRDNIPSGVRWEGMNVHVVGDQTYELRGGLTNLNWQTASNSLNLFDKATDDSDDITEGSVNLFLTSTERSEIASNTLKNSFEEPDTAKTTPVDADTFTLWDSAASFVSKKLNFANLKATLKAYFDTIYFDKTTETSDDITEGSTNLFFDLPDTAKTTPVDADVLTLWDDDDDFVAKKLTWANLKATLKTYLDTLYSKDLVTHTSGLSINVKAFVMYINEANVTIPTETITLPASTTHYIGYDLVDYSVHYLRRNYQDGMIWVAKVTTNGSTVTDIEQITPILPCTKISAFKEKNEGGNRALKVALLGDSITEGVDGGGTSWEDKLFNASASSFGYNVPNVSNFTSDNYGSGGQTSHYGALLTAKAIRSGYNSNYNGTGISWDAQDQSNVFSVADYKVLRDSPIFRGGYDLAIIGFGVNGGSNKMAWLENTVKNLREKNIDVIVLTLNFRSATLEEYFDEGITIKKICDNYGAALADTWAFMREQEYEGTSTLADEVHPNEAGKTAYANAIRSIINDITQERCVVNILNYRTIKEETDATLARNFPNSAEFDGVPETHTGTRIASSISNDLLNPSMQFNGEAKATSVIELTTGEIAYFSHGYASGYDIVIDGSSTGEFDYMAQNATIVRGSVSHPSFTGNRPEIEEGQQVSSYTAGVPSQIVSKAVQIKCTSGTIKLYGILWHTFKTKTIQFRDVSLDGLWSQEAENYGLDKSLYTDRDGDFITFEYEGSSAYVLLGRGSAGGLVDIYLNGEIYITGQDLYSTGTYWTPIHINSGTSSNYDDVPIKKNVVTMILNGANGSAGTPTAKNRRLSIASIKVLDRN